MKVLTTPQEFYDHFNSIPDNNWTTGTVLGYHNDRCAIGWCAGEVGDIMRKTSGNEDALYSHPNAIRLADIFCKYFKKIPLRTVAIIHTINDEGCFYGKYGVVAWRSSSRHPKDRILEALTLVINLEKENSPKYPDITGEIANSVHPISEVPDLIQASVLQTN